METKDEVKDCEVETLELKREITHNVVHLHSKHVQRKSTFRKYKRLGKNKNWSNAFFKIKSARSLMMKKEENEGGVLRYEL